jgi:hypothetical protein
MEASIFWTFVETCFQVRMELPRLRVRHHRVQRTERSRLNSRNHGRRRTFPIGLQGTRRKSTSTRERATIKQRKKNAPPWAEKKLARTYLKRSKNKIALKKPLKNVFAFLSLAARAKTTPKH